MSIYTNYKCHAHESDVLVGRDRGLSVTFRTQMKIVCAKDLKIQLSNPLEKWRERSVKFLMILPSYLIHTMRKQPHTSSKVKSHDNLRIWGKLCKNPTCFLLGFSHLSCTGKQRRSQAPLCPAQTYDAQGRRSCQGAKVSCSCHRGCFINCISFILSFADF